MTNRAYPVFAALAFLTAAVVTAQSGQVRELKPVTDDTLRSPSPDDWLHWRRTLDGWGYSPLNQINRQNVRQLQLAWSWAMHPGSNQATPLVHDGVMYVPNPNSIVQALDAATGDLIWEYRREFPQVGQVPAGEPQRNIAIWDDKIFLNTADAHIVALNARTGEVVWDATVADHSKGYEVHERPDHREGQGRGGHDGVHALQRGCLLHHGARRPDREGSLADVHGGAAWRAGR